MDVNLSLHYASDVTLIGRYAPCATPPNVFAVDSSPPKPRWWTHFPFRPVSQLISPYDFGGGFAPLSSHEKLPAQPRMVHYGEHLEPLFKGGGYVRYLRWYQKIQCAP